MKIKKRKVWSDIVYETIIIEKPTGEKVILKSHDKLGNKIEFNLETERDKFLHPEKYE